MPRAAKQSGATVESLLASVRAAHFTRTSGFTEGYDLREVDAFLGALEEAIARRSPVDRLIASVEFTPVRVRPGYDTSEVDTFLADLDERAAGVSHPDPVPETAESTASQEAIALVQHARFTTVRRLGYKIDQVDALLDQLVDALRSGSSLQAVLDRRPPSRTLAGEGYAVNEVEQLLTTLGLHRPDFASTRREPAPPAARRRPAPGRPPAQHGGPDDVPEGEEPRKPEEHDTTSVLDDLLTHDPPAPTRRGGAGARRWRRGERAEQTAEQTAEQAPEPEAPSTPARTFEVTMHAVDPAALCAFWCEVLGYRTAPAADEKADEADEDHSLVAIPLSGEGPRVRFEPIPRRRGGLVRTRLDVVVAPGAHGPAQMAALAAEAQRLVALGAAEVERQEPADEHATGHLVLRDPEGNEFSLR